ncbi:MAG: aspartate aminotransferase family protein [SAR202 cluster bacterium]|nr:aspartate aminotransferase family protein [SAR202 cluster bacterium]
MTTRTHSAEQIAALKQTAGDHMFLHAQQTSDWRGTGPRMYVKGEGVWVWDVEGNKYLDAMAGLWFKSAGYGRKEIADAVYKQMTAIDSPPAGGSVPVQVELAGKVSELYHDKNARLFFVSGGSEAVETAVKMSKKYHALNGKGAKHKIIARRGSYHGGTAMSSSLGRANADTMGPEMVGAENVVNTTPYRCAYCDGKCNLKCADEFDTVINWHGADTVAAIIAEPVSAAAGIHIPHPDYWPRLRQIADKYDVLLIADEVITGFGRLGSYFGMERFGVKPDLTTVAKALSSGYAPIAAAIATKRVADTFIGDQSKTFRHLITFGGHPIAAAAGVANLEIYRREKLVENSKKMGEYLYEQLQKLYEHSIVGDVRGGYGLLAAVELVQDRKTKKRFPAEAGLAKKVPQKLTQKQIVSFRAADVISLCPPLIVTKDDVDFIVNALDETIVELEKELLGQ